jgi:hypothetical protein
MYLLYIDESGDCGLPADGSPTRYFMLSGLVVHELRWDTTLERLIGFRRRLKNDFGLNMSEELHAAAMISHSGGSLGRTLSCLKKYQRLALLRYMADELASMPDISLINVVADKTKRTTKEDVFEYTWKAMFQRFENTLQYKNFPGPANADDRGMIFADNTDGTKLTAFLRKMRKYNPVPSRFGGTRNLPVRKLVEDPNLRDSQHSYFVQAVDCVAYLLKQHVLPSRYMQTKGGNAYFKRLEPVLCKVAGRNDPFGIVWT